MGLLGSKSNRVLHESNFWKGQKIYIYWCPSAYHTQHKFQNKYVDTIRDNCWHIVLTKKSWLNFVIYVDKFASSAKCSEKVECLPWNDGNHSAAVFDGCADVHMYCHSGCKVSSMKTQAVSKLFWLEVPYNFFHNPTVIIYTEKIN